MALGTQQYGGLWEAMGILGGAGRIGDNRDIGGTGEDIARTGMRDIGDTSMGRGSEGTPGQGGAGDSGRTLGVPSLG